MKSPRGQRLSTVLLHFMISKESNRWMIFSWNDGDVHRASSSNNSVVSSSMYGGRDVHMFLCHDMPLKEEAPFTISDLSEENMSDSQYGDELSSEELVLPDLQRSCLLLFF